MIYTRTKDAIEVPNLREKQFTSNSFPSNSSTYNESQNTQETSIKVSGTQRHWKLLPSNTVDLKTSKKEIKSIDPGHIQSKSISL